MTQEQINKLHELKKLFDAGILTQEEMQTEKAKILGNDIDDSKAENGEDETICSDVEVQNTNVVDIPSTSSNQTGKIFIYSASGIIVLLFIVAILFSRTNKPEETYSEPEYDQIEHVDEGSAPIMESEESKSDAASTDDDEFAYDPWSGTIRMEGLIYRLCTTCASITLHKKSSDMYEGTIYILLGEFFDDSRTKFDPNWGSLEGVIRARADGNMLTVVMDSYKTKPGGDGNFCGECNLKGQIFRITNSGSSYSAKAVGEMENLFDENNIEVSK